MKPRCFVFYSLLGTISPQTERHDLVFGLKQMRRSAANEINLNLKPIQPGPTLPNPAFIFHNKIPKSGSTTLANILHALEDRNRFNLRHFHPCIQKPCQSRDGEDGRAHSQSLTEKLKSDLAAATPSHPVMVIKHHLFTNFSLYGVDEPTWINVAREPVSRFVSSYYFRRYGFNRHEGVRNKRVKNGERKVEMELEECISTEAPECSESESNQAFLEYICGSSQIWPDCATHASENRPKALERAKKHVLHNYFVIGILEDIENTLSLLERMIPSVFTGAPEIYEKIGDQILNQTMTAKKGTISEHSRRKLEQGPLRYQVDLYNLIKALYQEKLHKYGITK